MKKSIIITLAVGVVVGIVAYRLLWTADDIRRNESSFGQGSQEINDSDGLRGFCRPQGGRTAITLSLITLANGSKACAPISYEQ